MRTYRALPIVALFVSSFAHAQPAPPPPMPPPAIPERVGLELGGGVWGGHMECQSQNGRCDGLAAAGGADLEASWFFNPRWGVYADTWVMAHTENAFTISQEIGTAGLRWRPIPILTLQAGIGAAHASFSYGGVTVGTSDTGGAVLAGAALDVFRAPRWALAVEARAASGFYGNDANGMATIKGSNVGVGAELSFFGF